MKAFAIVFLFLSLTAFGLTPEERRVVSQMKDTIVVLRGKLETAQKANGSALSALTQAVAQSAELTEQAKAAAEQCAQLAAERDRLSGEIAVAKAKYDKLNSRYQTAQLIVALFTGFAVGLIVLQFTHALQPPYGLIVPIAAGAAAFFGIYIIL